MRQIRVSSDVWGLAELEKQRLGLKTEREAIESIVRRFNKLQATEQENSERPSTEEQANSSDR